MTAKKKYVNGLDKLAFAESQVIWDGSGNENTEWLAETGLLLER